MANKNTRKKKKVQPIPASELTPEQKKARKAQQKKETQEIREKNKARNANRPKKERRSVKQYFHEVMSEMKKVVWPTSKELGQYTVIVVVTCAAFALMFWAVDSGVLALLKSILGISM